MDKDMAYGHGMYTMDMDVVMQYGLGHAGWTWTCSMDRDMQRRHVQVACTMNMHHGHGHAPWTWMCNKYRYGNRHAAWTWTCNIAEDMFHELHAAWT
jgi:hypothetical protein